MVPKTGLEPVRVAPHAPQTCASTNSATWAQRTTSTNGGARESYSRPVPAGPAAGPAYCGVPLPGAGAGAGTGFGAAGAVFAGAPLLAAPAMTVSEGPPLTMAIDT